MKRDVPWVAGDFRVEALHGPAHADEPRAALSEAAEGAGFVLAETAAPRNVWNKASAANAIVLKLLDKKEAGEVEEIGLVIEPFRVTGCYKKA